MTETKARKVAPLKLEVREVEQHCPPAYNLPNRPRPGSAPGAGSPFTAKPAA
jgi:hypothetical protein